jgi:tetratricopeptide (TPR) repeat protein
VQSELQAGCEGWIGGWTLSSPSDVLSRETASPLGIVLADRPLSLQVDIPGRAATISFPPGQNLFSSICAYGLRIQSSSPEENYLCSCFKLDASTLIIEADNRFLSGFSDEPEANSGPESVMVVTSGHHHLVAIINRQKSPSRMVLMSGAGEREGLLTKARSFIHHSAHARFDQVYAGSRREPTGRTASLSSYDYVISRLRPASPSMPYPWLTDADAEPLWDTGLVYSLFNSLLARDKHAAAGILKNSVELIKPDGSIPVAGGNSSPLFSGTAAYPVLMRMILLYFQRTGDWPFDLAEKAGALSHYLVHAMEQRNDDPDGTFSTALYVTLIHNEVAIWKEIHLVAGQPLDQSIRHINKTYELFNQAQSLDQSPENEWLALIDRRHPSAQRMLTAEKYSRVIFRELVDDDDPAWWTFALIILEELSTINHRIHNQWLNEINSIAVQRWQNSCRTINVERRIHHTSRLLVTAGFHSWLGSLAKSMTLSVIVEYLTWMNRYRTWVIGLAAAAIIAAGGYLITVQMRTTMTFAEYETRLGLVMQDYHSGKFQDALAKLDEMEKKENRKNPLTSFIIGKVHYRQKSYRDAAAYFAQVIERTPDDASAHFNLGLSHFRAGEYETAGQIFRKTASKFEQTNPSLAARARQAEKIAMDIAKTEATANAGK